MHIGISSACFYPMKTEQAIKRCGELGFRNLELFVNCNSEMQGEHFRRVNAMLKEYDMQVGSVHPYTSFSESFMLFGSYERRIDEFVESYKRFFDFCARIGSDKFVLHGGNTDAFADGEEYFERFAKLCRAAEPFGVAITHENVVHKRGESPQFMRKLADYIGPDFAMTLDIKQCRRAGEDPYEFIRLLGKHIVNVHISDYDERHDCIVPLTGKFDFQPLFQALRQVGYDGNYIIELYEDGYQQDTQILGAARQLEEMLCTVEAN